MEANVTTFAAATRAAAFSVMSIVFYLCFKKLLHGKDFGFQPLLKLVGPLRFVFVAVLDAPSVAAVRVDVHGYFDLVLCQGCVIADAVLYRYYKVIGTVNDECGRGIGCDL